jgi:hypothetical protein
MSLTSPITGLAQTGFTSPTYTVVLDRFPGNNGTQYACTALGGTQVGVSAHSADKPFTLSAERPPNVKVATVNGSGVTVSTGRNKHVFRTRKGMPAVSGQPALLMIVETTVSIPVGAESVSPAEIRGGLSAHFGMISQQSAAFGDQCVTAVVTL